MTKTFVLCLDCTKKRWHVQNVQTLDCSRCGKQTASVPTAPTKPSRRLEYRQSGYELVLMPV